MQIIGHQKIIKILDRAIAENAVNHAYLFTGPENVGKFTVARGIAGKLLPDKSEIDPDFIILQPEIAQKNEVVKKSSIKIEQMREFLRKINLSPQSGKHKIAIIDEAEKMNKAAQNSLLKTLEESPPGVILILISQNERMLLPTIISRCQKVRFRPVPDGELAANIENRKEREEILFWSLGRPGLMFSLSEDEAEFNFRRESLREIRILLSQNTAARFAMAESMSKDVNLSVKKLNLWSVILREAMRGRQEILKLSGEKTLELLENISRCAALLKDTSANPRLILENLFLKF